MSGAGKSSLLLAGLLPQLSREAIPVAYDKIPTEPDLARRLLAQLLSFGSNDVPRNATPDQFAALLDDARNMYGHAPINIVDQFEDLFKDDHGARALSQLGPLMATTVQVRPETSQPCCRWIICYRQDFHGEVVTWLGDVLKQAAETVADIYDRLPFNLREHGRFQSWSLPLVGEPPPGVDAEEAATACFLDAICKPLALRRGPADARHVYPWRMSERDARMVAEAFSRVRRGRPRAPLVPELQVVMNHLLEQASSQSGDVRIIKVPGDVEQMIGHALERHLKEALEQAFPITRDAATRRGRTRALLALRQLVDAEGRRAASMMATDLVAALGPDGETILQTLSGPSVRLVVPEVTNAGLRYSLAHDQVAAVVLSIFESPALRAQYGIDEKLLLLGTFVSRRTELYHQANDLKALELSTSEFRRIRELARVLLSDEKRRQWWRACEKAMRSKWRRRIYGGFGVVSVSTGALVAWISMSVTWSPLAGGPGGSPFKASCGPGQVLVGLYGTGGSGNDRRIFSVGPVCSEAHRVPRWTIDEAFTRRRPALVPTGPATKGDRSGSSQGEPFEKTCAGIHVVVGIELGSVSFSFPDGRSEVYLTYPATLRCASSLNFSGKPAITTADIFGAGVPYANVSRFTCPDGQAVTVVRGRSGQWIDALGVGCERF